jgi:sRNA-binding carbon storage regulator CsrA
MLVLTRAAGESLRIGKSTLLIQRLRPAIEVVVREQGLEQRYEFSAADLPQHPVIQLAEARVKLMSLQRTEITIAIDAPRSVHISRGELRPRVESPD